MIRVEIRPKGATLEILLLDASLSPPLRIVNKSAVTLVYHQAEVDTTSELAPGAAAPYAWDDVSKVRGWLRRM